MLCEVHPWYKLCIGKKQGEDKSDVFLGFIQCVGDYM